MKDSKPLWQPRPHAASYEKFYGNFHAPPTWPVAADIDGDGRLELLTPDETSTLPRNGYSADHPWGSLEMLDAATGERRWQRRLLTIDQQIDRFLVGPDINGDGAREVFVATLDKDNTNRTPDVSVEALSGRDGQTLWRSRQPTERLLHPANKEVLGELRWWNAGPDGWPQLIVPVHDDPTGEPLHLDVFSAGTGALVQASNRSRPRSAYSSDTGQPLITGVAGLAEPLVFDADGDGLDDLLCFAPNDRRSFEHGGKLIGIRGTPPQPWRRLGGNWQAGRDYDGDGIDDVISGPGDWFGLMQRVTVLSGRDGRELYKVPVETPHWTGAVVQPLDVDLDGDGVNDVCVVAKGQRGNETESPPVLAFSGKTGRSLWRPTFGAGWVGQTLFVRARDLDADSRPELIYIAEMSFAGADGSAPSISHTPVWLVVLEGSTGRLRWKQQLSEGTNLAGDPASEPDLSLAFADIDLDGVADIVTPAFGLGRSLELRAFSGRRGDLIWSQPASPVATGKTQETAHWFSWMRTPMPAAADLDGDGRPEVLCVDFVSRDATDLKVTKSAYRLMALDGQTGIPRWSHELASLIPPADEGTLQHRPRPLVISLGDNQRGVVYWSWAANQTPGQIVVLDAQGRESWRFPVYGTHHGISLRPWNHDLNGDGCEELIVAAPEKVIPQPGSDNVLFRRGVVIEAYDLARRERLWRTPLRDGGHPEMATILDVRPGDGNLSATVELLAAHTLYGLAGDTGKPGWTCASLPIVRGESAWSVATLRHREVHLPPRVLIRQTNGAVCRVAMPSVASPFESQRTDAVTRSSKQH